MPSLMPVILCGGSGTRLWPLSRKLYPKQFMDLDGRTLFGDTLARAAAVPSAESPLVICNEEQRFLAAAIMQKCASNGRIILEPDARNTAPAIALAALVATQGGLDPLLLVLPSDHAIEPIPAFLQAVQAAVICAQEGYLVTFGVVPSYAETGFGYISRGESLGEGYKVDRFMEKPSLEKAKEFLAQGGYYWNSGMFLFKASLYLGELERLAPEIYLACKAAVDLGVADLDFFRVNAEAFLASPSDSIDYAIVERTERSAVVPLAATWSDLGSWEAFHASAQKDRAGNVCKGDIITEDVRDSYLHGTHRLVAALGVDNLTIVETADAVLVAHRSRVQDVKAILGGLKAAKRAETDTHVRTYRPWGSYEILTTEERFQTKRIVVNPGAVLSLQLHHHRAEHWIVVQGTAKVTVGDKQFLLKEDESTYIPLGMVHRLENPGRIPLALIEVQTGSYLGEDDIVRLEDTYGRCGASEHEKPFQRVEEGRG